MKNTFLLWLALIACLSTNPSIAADNGVAFPKEYFGLHIHRSDQGTTWPTVPFGSWRLWDAYVTWADLEPAPNQWRFERLDRLVAMARITGTDVLLPLANTPTWAAARSTEPSAYKLGNASEPASMDAWRNYVKTVGNRYKGKVRNYEIWNEPNIKHHYSGSVEKLVEMTCEASRILKTIDPANQIISPAATAGARGHIDYLISFLELGGKNCIDIVAYHFYVPNGSPEDMVPIIRNVKAAMKSSGIGEKPLWNTETGWWIANGDGTPDSALFSKGGWKKLEQNTQAGEYLRRAFIVARVEGVDRFYWYSWDHRDGLGAIEPTSGAPKPIVAAWSSLVAELVGATNLSCEKSSQRWECTYKRKDGSLSAIRWLVE